MSFGFEFQFTNVRLYRGPLDHFLNSPSGEVGRHMRKVGTRIYVAARAQVGVDTGELRSSIYLAHERRGSFQQVRIGSDNDIALIHHEGTRPHVIRPNTHEYLRFRKGTRVVYSRQVFHPGTQPNRYLSDNLRVAFI